MEILSILSALMGVGTGVYQLLKGNEAADTEQPKYEIPKEYAQALGMAKQGAYSNMPGYQQAISNLQQSDASSFERAKDSASSGSDLLGFLANRGVTSNRGLNQLAAQNAAYKVGAEQRYMGALGQYGMLKDKQWNINELQPYQDAMRTSAVMTEGGIQNIFGGITGGIQNYAALKQADSYQGLADSQKSYYQMMMDQWKNGTGQQPQQSQLGYTPNLNASFGGLNLNPNSNSGMGFGLQQGWGGYGQQGNSLMDSYGYGSYYNWFNPGG
jgi:hypothetical protein